MKNFSCLLFLILFPVLAFCQDWRFYIKGGVTTDAVRIKLRFVDGSIAKRTKPYYIGFQGGYNLEYDINSNFSISTGLEYCFRRGQNFFVSKVDIPPDKLNYLSIPISLSYSITPNLKYFVGVQGDYLLTKDFNIIDRNDGNGFISYDLSLITGLTYRLKPIAIGFKWRHGIIPYIQDSYTRSSEITDFESRSISFELFTAYVFE